MYEKAASIIRPWRENWLDGRAGSTGRAEGGALPPSVTATDKAFPVADGWRWRRRTSGAGSGRTGKKLGLVPCRPGWRRQPVGHARSPTSGPDRRRIGRWLVVVGLTLVASACAPGGPWQESGGAEHPLVGRIYQPATGRFVDQATLVADLARADFVLLGERHDNRDHQRLEALLVQALERASERPRPVAFEMIPSDRQLALVEYRQAHPGDVAGLGQAVGWAALGWPGWALYAPIAEAALERGGELVAADLSPAQSAAVFRAGPDILKATMVRRTGLDQDLPAELAESLADELRAAHCGQIPEPVVDGLFRVQRARDAMMADRLAMVAGRSGGVLIAGNGHVRTDRGVPWYLARVRPGSKTISVGLLEVWTGRERSSRPAVRLRLVHAAGGGDQPCTGAEEAPRSG